MEQQLRKPEFWQDFEELCKRLWGDIWSCPEIKRNGRNGNAQNGVDVYGVPLGENKYYGIQCKGKDEYTHAQLTKTEIDDEIDKAKTFEPPLKKFYLATTSNKDAEIEKYVRLKDIESRKAGMFEIHLFCWEDIVSLIDENRKTHDWYVKKIDFKTRYAVKVMFDDGTDTMVFEPILVRNQVTYRVRPEPTYTNNFPFVHGRNNPDEIRKVKLDKLIDPQPIRYYMDGIDYNKSACDFYLIIENNGDNVIEDYKLRFHLEGEIISVDTTNKETSFLEPPKKYNTSIDKSSPSGIFKPTNNMLVQNDSVSTDKICFRPSENDQTVLLHWELIARDFKANSQLTIYIHPRVIDKKSVEYFERYLEDEIRIENYFGEVD